MDKPISSTILQQRHRARIAIAIVALASVCAAAWGINRAVRPSVDADDIIVAEVRRGDVANTVNASGLVIPVHEEVVASPVTSRVSRVHAKLGQQVEQGQLLLELDDRDIRLAIDALAEQLAQQDNRIVVLTQEMEKNRKQIASAIELLEVDLRSARAKHERYLKLRESGAVSGEDMLSAELNVTRTQIQLRQQRELSEDTRRVTSSGIEAANLQKSILKKQLAQQEQLLARARVSAPFSGIVTSLVSEEGASVAAGQLVARVSELNNYRIEATLSDFHARMLAPGQQVCVEQNGEVLAGTVHTVLPEIQNGAIKLLVDLAEPNNKLLRNKMRVDVNIITERRANTLVIDSGPAFNGRGRQPAWLVQDGAAVKTWLELGSGDGKVVEVVAGARPGARFIVSDTASFKELDSIRISD
ncbi:efflux RND transporter periplasmic adaptor subunit [Pseudoduganella sp. GCM10020061]|uniref:efflux RND transporter periplasmic adaptor subunit n=1 Tax=Pseudoduganella sp. GCM10020061 TaxID=3317345 RepID=UPI00362D96C3